MNQGGVSQYQLDKNELDVPHPFTDSVSDIKIKQMAPGQAYMAVSSWDGKICNYMVSVTNNNSMTPEVNPAQSTQCQGPVLGICWQADPPQ